MAQDDLSDMWMRFKNRVTESGKIAGKGLNKLFEAVDKKDWQGAINIIKESFFDFINFLLADKRLIVLGPYGSGKTSLLNYVSEGRVVEPGGPTGGREKKMRRVSVGGGVYADVEYDVGGDPIFREAGHWRDALRDANPQAIIYVLNGAPSEEQILNDLRSCLDDSLTVYTFDTKRGQFTLENGSDAKLKVVYVLLSHYDQWKNDKGKVDYDLLVSKVRLSLSEALKQRNMPVPVLGVYNIQLDPLAQKWPEVELALQHFSKDLVTNLYS